jgi:hypothetical protein
LFFFIPSLTAAGQPGKTAKLAIHQGIIIRYCFCWHNQFSFRFTTPLSDPTFVNIYYRCPSASIALSAIVQLAVGTGPVRFFPRSHDRLSRVRQM